MIVLALVILGWLACGVLGHKLFHAYQCQTFDTVWTPAIREPRWMILLGPLLLVSVIAAILTDWVENK